MLPMERVLTALSHREPDRVPMFLLTAMQGAKELGVTIKDYFSRPENLVEGQLKLHKKYGSDCLFGFFYGAIEAEAWGGEVLFRDDGPPNSGNPIIRSFDEITRLEKPDARNSPVLGKVYDALRALKSYSSGEIPIIGIVMSPFSLPVMQIGFDKYFELIYEEPLLFERLMRVNEEFCVEWANAQLEAGADVIGYFDPVSSTTIIPPELYLKTGYKIAKRTLGRIKGPTATHFASGRVLPVIGRVIETGTAAIGVSTLEDLAETKAACKGKITVLGNLNGIEMRHWTEAEAEAAVKEAIFKAGAGGGFILSDNHGEIPYQVPDEVLLAISEAARKWGRYPLNLASMAA